MNTNEIASTHLGKKSAGSEVYNPALLVAVPRAENREKYGIKITPSPQPSPSRGEGACNDSFSTLQPFNHSTNISPHPPHPERKPVNPSGDNSHTSIHPYLQPSDFFGYDIWHAYEFSCMTENGIPITRVMKMKYPCDNEFLVESKSLKLYLNSFNMMRFGKNTQECLNICKSMIEKDLSELLKTTVEINFLDKNTEQVRIFDDFENIMDFVDETTLKITDFKENPEILEVEEAQEREYKLTFESLRSNCRVTHQPDFGDAFIYYRSKKHIKEDSLVKYLTSFRSEYHFHEECCEMIFKRLSDILDEEDELMVCALYTRRGGIDICPVRWRNAAKQLGSQAARFNNNDMDSSQFTVHGSHDMDLSPYHPIALSPYANDIKALLNIQIFARNGIKQ